MNTIPFEVKECQIHEVPDTNVSDTEVANVHESMIDYTNSIKIDDCVSSDTNSGEELACQEANEDIVMRALREASLMKDNVTDLTSLDSVGEERRLISIESLCDTQLVVKDITDISQQNVTIPVDMVLLTDNDIEDVIMNNPYKGIDKRDRFNVRIFRLLEFAYYSGVLRTLSKYKSN